MPEESSYKVCPFCTKKVSIEDFSDPVSIKEFKISGLCQECQDSFFEDPDQAIHNKKRAAKQTTRNRKEIRNIKNL